MNQRGEVSSGGIGFLDLLGLVFIVLKIIDVKPIGDWSWWWVTAPLWGVLALVVVVIAIFYWAER